MFITHCKCCDNRLSIDIFPTGTKTQEVDFVMENPKRNTEIRITVNIDDLAHIKATIDDAIRVHKSGGFLP